MQLDVSGFSNVYNEPDDILADYRKEYVHCSLLLWVSRKGVVIPHRYTEAAARTGWVRGSRARYVPCRVRQVPELL